MKRFSIAYILCVLCVLCGSVSAQTTQYITLSSGTNQLAFVVPPSAGTTNVVTVTNLVTLIVTNTVTVTNTVVQVLTNYVTITITNVVSVTNCPPCPPGGTNCAPPFTGVAVFANDQAAGILAYQVDGMPKLVSCQSTPLKINAIARSGNIAVGVGTKLVPSTVPGGATITLNFFGVWDVSYPPMPKLLGSIEGGTTTYSGVEISGAWAYVAVGTAGIKTISLANPAAPAIVGSLDTPGFAVNVNVVGNRAYVADSSAGIRIVDVSNPAVPVSLGFLDTPGTAKAISVNGIYAYVADNVSVRVVNVSNPAAPVEQGSIAGVTALDVTVDSGRLYVGASTQGLFIYSLASPTVPALLGSLPPIGGVNAKSLGVSASGSQCYVANFDGLTVINVSNPGAPTVTASLPGYGAINSVRK